MISYYIFIEAAKIVCNIIFLNKNLFCAVLIMLDFHFWALLEHYWHQYTEEKKIDCCSKLWHSIFNWLGSSQFLIALDLLIFYADIADRLTQPKIGCCNQKLAAGAN